MCCRPTYNRKFLMLEYFILYLLKCSKNGSSYDNYQSFCRLEMKLSIPHPSTYRLWMNIYLLHANTKQSRRIESMKEGKAKHSINKKKTFYIYLSIHQPSFFILFLLSIKGKNNRLENYL